MINWSNPSGTGQECPVFWWEASSWNPLVVCMRGRWLASGGCSGSCAWMLRRPSAELSLWIHRTGSHLRCCPERRTVFVAEQQVIVFFSLAGSRSMTYINKSDLSVRQRKINLPFIYFYYCDTFPVNPGIEEMFRLASQGNEIVFTLCLSPIVAVTMISLPLRHKQSKQTCSCCWRGEGNLRWRTSNYCWITAVSVFIGALNVRFAIEKTGARAAHK